MKNTTVHYKVNVTYFSNSLDISSSDNAPPLTRARMGRMMCFSRMPCMERHGVIFMSCGMGFKASSLPPFALCAEEGSLTL